VNWCVHTHVVRAHVTYMHAHMVRAHIHVYMRIWCVHTYTNTCGRGREAHDLAEAHARVSTIRTGACACTCGRAHVYADAAHAYADAGGSHTYMVRAHVYADAAHVYADAAHVYADAAHVYADAAHVYAVVCRYMRTRAGGS